MWYTEGMAETNRKSRAAYRKAYRASKAASNGPRLPHTCPQCHQAFTVERSDATYCSEACRARAWRLVTHRAVQHHPEGWIIPANRADAGQPEWCGHELKAADRHFCGQPATWRLVSCTNATRTIPGGAYRCEAHCPPEMRRPCDPEAACYHGARCPAKQTITT